MSSILLSVPELFNTYRAWICKNPQIAGDYETTAKWLSYFIAGRINNSHVVSELVYCLSNLLVLFNDQIIRKDIRQNSPSTKEKIKLWLTIIEYSEVFCELSVEKAWGKTGKWLMVIAIQVFKGIARILLISKHKEIIIENPPIPPLERKLALVAKGFKGGYLKNDNSTDSTAHNVESVSFTLKRSGRTIRKVESSPPLSLRNWKPLDINNLYLNDNETCTDKDILRKKHLIAEYLYISKPIVHLILMGLFGTRTWRPWISSLALDLASLQLYKSTQSINLDALSNKQKLQLSKRTVLLLLYLIRSPFYEEHSGDKINAFLISLSNNVPLVKIICKPLLQYLPFWQSTYFYMWST